MSQMRRLPVIEAFSHAVRSTTSNLPFAFHVSWPWMAVLLPILIAGQLYVLAGVGDSQATTTRAIPVQVLVGLCAMLAFSSIAVNWHRYVLLDEVPQGRERLRLDDKVWRYFGNAILIVLIIGICAGVIALAAILLGIAAGVVSVATDTAGFAALVGMLAMIAFFTVAVFGLAAFYRLSIKLPAVALGRSDFGLADAWRSSAGNIWPLTGIAVLYFLVGICFSLVLIAFNALVGFIGGSATVALVVAIQLVVNWVLTILGITLLTSLYGFFIEGRSF